jgi:hypothetical protein
MIEILEIKLNDEIFQIFLKDTSKVHIFFVSLYFL